jgi:uncharacterized phage-associated protein
MAIDIRDAAKYFLTQVGSDDEMTQLKLQKLCYYAQAWYLAINHDHLFNQEFEAWAHGPANRTLWEEYREFSWHPIPVPHDFNPSQIPRNERSFLDDVWEMYGKFTAKYLEKLTHKEEPWLDARDGTPEGEYCDTPIDDALMKEYYGKMLKA